jgi:RNAse (barnase) inhibitor barstar
VFNRSSSELFIDVGECRSREELHRLLAEAFRFPSYYGGNWDAFDECIRDVDVPSHVRVVGTSALRFRLKCDAALLIECLSAYSRDRSDNLTIVVE